VPARQTLLFQDPRPLVERLGHDVHVVLGSERNFKITRPGDLELAEFYLAQERAQPKCAPAHSVAHPAK